MTSTYFSRFHLLIAICMLFLATGTTLFAKPLNQVIVIVNDDVITQNEWRQELEQARIQLRGTKPINTAFKKQLLNHLIDKKLQLQVAKQVHLTVSDEELKVALQGIADRNNLIGGLSELTERLKMEGIDPDQYRAHMREQMLLQKLQQQEIARKITITPDEIQEAMSQQSSKGKDQKALKQAIEQRLFKEKFVTASKVWFSKLRSMAYIDIKIDVTQSANE